MTFASRVAQSRPDEIALRDYRESLSWADTDARLRPAVNALMGLPFGPHRRVAVLAANSVDTLLAYVACTLAGTSAVAVNSHLKAEETAFILDDSRADVVLCDTSTAAVAAAAAAQTGVRTVIAWGEGDLPADVVAWSDFSDDAGDSEPSTAHPPRRTLVYTSGTTGRPKGVELPHTSWVAGKDIDEHVDRLSENSLVAHGRHLVVGPMYHSGPLTSTRLFLGGAPVTVLGKFDAEALLDAIQRDGVRSSIMVPTHFQRLLALPQEVRSAYDCSALRFVLQVGAKCPEDVKRAMIEWWGPIVWESYGASEVGTTCMISAEDWLTHLGSVGRAVPPFEAFIRTEAGTEAPSGEEGELWFRDATGHGIEYISGLGSAREFTLGEIGRMDQDGYVWVTDRASDMVVSGGVNIYPAEIEQSLEHHGRVAEAACYGVPDVDLGERLVALVVPTRSDEPPTAEELTRYCREQLAGYKCPKAFEIVDALPRTPVGKLDKRFMRSHHPSGQPTGADASNSA